MPSEHDAPARARNCRSSPSASRGRPLPRPNRAAIIARPRAQLRASPRLPIGSNISSGAFGIEQFIVAMNSSTSPSSSIVEQVERLARRRAAARSRRSSTRLLSPPPRPRSGAQPRCSAISRWRSAVIAGPVSRLAASAGVDDHVALAVEALAAIVEVGRADAQQPVVDDRRSWRGRRCRCRLRSPAHRFGSGCAGRHLPIAATSLSRAASIAFCSSQPSAVRGMTSTISGGSGSASRLAIAAAILPLVKY